VLEHLDTHTTIAYNLHKRVFPAAQRDSCFLMHMRRLDAGRFVAMSDSIEHEHAPDKYVRIKASVTLVRGGWLVGGCFGVGFSSSFFSCVFFFVF
jgi:collagen type IV alpha-3-binding protein